VEPTEVVVEVLRGDAAVAAEERLNLLVPAVNGLDVHIAADPFAGRQVERLMADAEGGGDVPSSVENCLAGIAI
jgi:hypothetical protein